MPSYLTKASKVQVVSPNTMTQCSFQGAYTKSKYRHSSLTPRTTHASTLSCTPSRNSRVPATTSWWAIPNEAGTVATLPQAKAPCLWSPNSGIPNCFSSSLSSWRATGRTENHVLIIAMGSPNLRSSESFFFNLLKLNPECMRLI